MGLAISLLPFYISNMKDVDTIKYKRVIIINNTEYTHISDETSSDDDIS